MANKGRPLKEEVRRMISIRLSEEAINKLKSIAESENRTQSNFIETIILTYPFK